MFLHIHVYLPAFIRGTQTTASLPTAALLTSQPRADHTGGFAGGETCIWKQIWKKTRTLSFKDPHTIKLSVWARVWAVRTCKEKALQVSWLLKPMETFL